MTDEELLLGFEAWQRRQGRARRTVESHRQRLGEFLEFSRGRRLAPAFWREEHLAEFDRCLRQRGASPKTRQSLLQSLRSWLRWAVRQGLLLHDPTRDLVLPNLPPNPRPTLTVRDLERLLANPDPDTWLGLRDLAVLETLYGTGLRLSECVALNLEDLDFTRRVLTVRQGKNGEARSQPIGDHLAGVLARYLEECRPRARPCAAERALFLSRRGSRLLLGGYGNRVHKRARQAGLKSFGPHQLRHAFATHLLEGGAELHQVQALLGHRCLVSTTLYTHVLEEELLEEYRRTHPRARRKRRRRIDL